MQLGSSSWSDLKSEYYHNLKTLQTARSEAHNSTVEMNRIYLEVIKKARDYNFYCMLCVNLMCECLT